MFKSIHVFASRFFQESHVDTLLINLWCFINIRLISFIGVSIVRSDESGAVVRLKVGRRTKNHLNSMYMGSQVIGAEIGPIFYAIKYCELNDLQINSEYASVAAEFYKKTRSKYVYFYFKDTSLIKDALIRADQTNDRQFQDVEVGVYDSESFEKRNLVSKFNFKATFRKRRIKKK